MPFDGSGNFTRVHDWTDDRDNGINILASRMDAEMDDYAVAFNMMFFRNGLVPMSGNLNMGTNRILALAAGSLGTYPISFNDDATTGFYLNGAGKFAVGVSGVKRGEFTSAGFDVVGAVTTTGNISIGGTGTFSNDVTILRATTPALRIANSAAGASEVIFSLDAGNNGLGSRDSQIRGGNNGSNQTYLDFYTSDAAAPAHAMRINSAGYVGLGTSAPGVKLEVQHNQASNSYFDYYNATNGGGIVFRQIVRNIANSGTTSVDIAKLTGGAFLINNNDTHANNYTAFGVGGAERMRIDSSGNVGIGTSSPGTKLSVVGQSHSSTGFSTTSDNATFTPSGFASAVPHYGIGAPGSNFVSLSGFGGLLFGSNGAERMRIASDGKVGIGVTPTTTLHTYGSGFNGGAIRAESSNHATSATVKGVNGAGINDSAYVNLSDGTNDVYLGLTGTAQIAGDFRIVVGGAERMRVTSAGVIQDGAGLELGYRNLPQTIKSAAFTFADVDRGKHLYYNGAAAAATINPNSTTAIPIGAAITIVNDGTGNLTITRGAAVALIWENVDANRILAPGGIATIVKVGTDRWFISGNNLS